MIVLAAFESTWSNARGTFGQGAPQPGSRYDGSAALRRMQDSLGSAMPDSRWTGPASSAYGAAAAEHRSVFGGLADLDQRLSAQIDRSAAVVAAGRERLDAIRQWVRAAAAAVPQSAAGERMLLPIVQKAIGEVVEVVRTSNGELNAIGARIAGLGDGYRMLGEQKFGREGYLQFAGGGDKDGREPDNEYERALRDAGLLDEKPSGYYAEWLENAERQGVPPETLVEIARRHNITPESFKVLEGMEKITDRDGKSFFLMPTDISADDARKAALMTYILNCGTDYDETPGREFPDTPPYSADEVGRIIERQSANSWSYNRDVGFVHGNGGRLVTTPNGMLMGLGGNEYQDLFSQGGGTTWGDIFMVNIDDPSDPAQTLSDMIGDGVMYYPTERGEGRPGNNRLDLDRILHHEEIHSRQWQRLGYLGFIDAYLTGKLVEIFTDHPLEKEAGLSDGGYE